MSRPIRNNLEYFSHDNKMRNDRKVKALRSKFGLTGYAVYCMILECLCEAEMLILKWDEIEIELVSGDFIMVSEELIQIIDYCCHLGLLNRSNGYLFCKTLDTRAGQVFGKRTNNLEGLRIGNEINLAETHVSGGKSTQRKGKESKEKESKENESIMEQWNELADSLNLSKIKSLSKTRLSKLALRVKEGFKIEEIIPAIKRQPFLAGDNGKDWKISFDWIIENDTNWMKVLEGNYIQSNNSGSNKGEKFRPL